MVDVGITSCELWEGHVEPCERLGRDARGEMSLVDDRRSRHFAAILERFTQAGLTLNANSLRFNDHFSGEEIDRGFELAKALGVPAITASANVNVVPRRRSARVTVVVGAR